MRENFVDSEEEIEERILDLIRQRRLSNVGDVVAEVQNFDRSITRDEIHDLIRRLEQRGILGLSESGGKQSIQASIVFSRASVGLWICVAVSAIALIAVYLFPQVEPWSVARLIIANLFLFIIPGYTLSQLLFSRNRLQAAERTGLSIVLSLAVVALIGMMLVYSPLGVRLESVIASVASFSIALAFVSAFGKPLFEGIQRKAIGV
jgi:hypothetical protein